MASPLLKQAWTVSAILINMFGQGMLLSYTTSLLPAVTDPKSSFKADLKTASWLASSIGLAGIPGFLLSSALMDIYGRKLAHGIVVAPGLIGWLLIYYATNIPMLMAGRVLGGLTAGATVSLGAVAIGEYTSPKYRGMFLNLKTAAVCMGGMAVHILGNYFSWRTVALSATIPYVIALIIILTWPESPSWLVKRHEYEKSEAAFFWLRGKDEATVKELDELIKAQMGLQKSSLKDSTFLDNVKEILSKFKRKDFLKPCFIIFNASILVEACGRHIFPAYALQIMEQLTGSKSQSFYYTLAIDMITTASALFSSVLVRMMKRRTLLFYTGFASFFLLMAVCGYLFLCSKGFMSKNSTVSIGMFVVYFILANFGCTPIPLALLGELFPLAHRGLGSAISGAFLSFALMVGLQMAPQLLYSIKVEGTFAVYGLLMGFSLLVLFFTLPETKDRTLQEIEDYFNCGSFRENEDNDKDVKAKMLS